MKRVVVAVLAVAVLAACGDVSSGRGWQLVAFDRNGPTYSVVLAQSQDDVDRIWERFHLALDKPTINFEEQVLIGLGHAVSGSCPEISFRGLVIEEDHVYGRYRFDTGIFSGGCTADANPAMFWLAVDRSALPERFTLSLAEEKTCWSCPEEAIEVDLTDPNMPEPWWAEPQLALVLDGDPSGYHFLIETAPPTETGDPLLYISPDGGWFRPGRAAMLFDRSHPSRLEVFSATCPSGRSCAQGQWLEKGMLVCAVDLVLRKWEDFTAVITFHGDGTCTGELVEGLNWP